MNAPKWFWTVLASCLVVLSAASAWKVMHLNAARGEYSQWQWQDGDIFNPSTGIGCGGYDGGPWICTDFKTGKRVSYTAKTDTMVAQNPTAALDAVIAQADSCHKFGKFKRLTHRCRNLLVRD